MDSKEIVEKIEKTLGHIPEEINDDIERSLEQVSEQILAMGRQLDDISSDLDNLPVEKMTPQKLEDFVLRGKMRDLFGTKRGIADNILELRKLTDELMRIK